MNKTSVSFGLARFVFISCLALAAVITTLVAYQVIDSVNIEYEKAANREVSTLSGNYRVFIEHHITLLTEQAKMPLLIQGLMQPESNLGKTQDVMESLTLLGHKYDEILLDFEGNTIHSTGKFIDFINYEWTNEILLNKATSIVKVIELDREYFWSIIVPVFYNGNVEGALATIIPISAINVEQNNAEMIEGIMIRIIKDGNVIAQFGNEVSGNTQTIDWKNTGVKLSFTVDDLARNEALSNVVLQVSFLIIVIIILTTILAYIYGYRYFVKPIIHLSETTSQLESGKDAPVLNENLRFKEFAELYTQFNRMSQKVVKRERALKQSYTKLSEANEELKQSESQLVQSEKMASIGVLAAGVAHEINNPIGFVRSNLEVLEDYFLDIKKYYLEFQNNLATEEEKALHKKLAKKYELEFLFDDAPPLLKSSLGGVSRVTEIIKSLKTFARVDQPEKVLTDINEGINATINMVWNEIKYRCQVHRDLQDIPDVSVFPGQLNQVFMNLLINASQAIEEKGNIYVRSFTEDNHVVIEIEDTGCGIEEDKISQIFSPFFTTKPIGEGTGLGLSISHQIIEQHKGQIEVKSAVGKGSCFSVKIPITCSIKNT